MTKKSWLALAVLALAGSVAQAQTWSNTDAGTSTTFKGCKTQEDSFVCTFAVSLTGSEDSKRVEFCAGSVLAVTSSGNSIPSSRKRFGTDDGSWGCDSTTVYKGVPFLVGFVFDKVPGGLKNVARISYYGKVINPTASMPTPTPTPAPPPAPAANLNIAGNWNATLSNCKQTAANTVVCTATLRK